ncbi:hypothetical protein [Porphyromonas endodontalis]
MRSIHLPPVTLANAAITRPIGFCRYMRHRRCTIPTEGKIHPLHAMRSMPPKGTKKGRKMQPNSSGFIYQLNHSFTARGQT